MASSKDHNTVFLQRQKDNDIADAYWKKALESAENGDNSYLLSAMIQCNDSERKLMLERYNLWNIEMRIHDLQCRDKNCKR